VWRIGQLARMAGVSGHTLRHYDRIGLLAPAAVDRVSGYRWYGAAELTRLERIRGLRQLGLSLRQIADLVDAPDPQVRQALAETVAALRRDIAAMSAAVAAAEDRLAVGGSVLPQVTHVSARRLRVRYRDVRHPSELADLCAGGPTTLLTWLTHRPTGTFRAAVAAGRAGEALTLPARPVVRATVPPAVGVVRAGHDLFDWLRRHHLSPAGPTVEEHLVDADGATATVLEIAVARPGTRSSA
jgi:DNA-binding transcriptional MerR regulator